MNSEFGKNVLGFKCPRLSAAGPKRKSSCFANHLQCFGSQAWVAAGDDRQIQFGTTKAEGSLQNILLRDRHKTKQGCRVNGVIFPDFSRANGPFGSVVGVMASTAKDFQIGKKFLAAPPVICFVMHIGSVLATPIAGASVAFQSLKALRLPHGRSEILAVNNLIIGQVHCRHPVARTFQMRVTHARARGKRNSANMSREQEGLIHPLFSTVSASSGELSHFSFRFGLVPRVSAVELRTNAFSASGALSADTWPEPYGGGLTACTNAKKWMRSFPCNQKRSPVVP